MGLNTNPLCALSGRFVMLDNVVVSQAQSMQPCVKWRFIICIHVWPLRKDFCTIEASSWLDEQSFPLIAAPSLCQKPTLQNPTQHHSPQDDVHSPPCYTQTTISSKQRARVSRVFLPSFCEGPSVVRLTLLPSLRQDSW